MGRFAHLHLHTEYSLLDGAVRLTQGKEVYPLLTAVKEAGQTAVAITDHGNLYGAVTFAKALLGSKLGIKGIFGSEFYIADDMYDKKARERDYCHLILLAKNDIGYHNLMKLSSASFVDGFYYKPRIDMALLRKHSEGIICLSACIAGKIPQLILRGDYDGALAHALELQSMFGEDFYIEIQDHGIPDEKKCLPRLKEIARTIGAKLVATNDVHYLKKSDADFQDTMMCVATGKKKNDYNRMRFEENEFYLKTEEEMLELFPDCPEAVYNTGEIVDKCTFNFMLKSMEYFLPKVAINDESYQRYVKNMDAKYLPRIEKEYDRLQALEDKAGSGVIIDRSRDYSSTYFRRLVYSTIEGRYPDMNATIDERMEYELETIIRLGFDNYYMVVWDFINYAKRVGVPVGPGRGSGAGSIVAYAIHITDIDPIRFGLIFERFLNAERVSMPDFDIDFCELRRGEVIKYVVEHYGAKNVTQIIAYSTMSAKAVIKDVARVYDVPFQTANDWVKPIPVMLDGKKPDILSCLGRNRVTKQKQVLVVPEFKKLYDENAEAREIIDIAIALEGMPRQPSMHAAGVVICSDDVTNHCPLQRNGPDITTQFDKTQIEDLGLLKMDFLGLTTLTDIDSALKLIKKHRGVDLDFDKLGDTDPKIYELIASGDTEAVFQLEGGGMTQFMTRLRPADMEEITAGISIYRPGPMQYADTFIAGKYNPQSITYLVPQLKDYLSVTNGVIVYQEQVMDIARGLAGFSYGGADLLRRAMGKKDSYTMTKNRELFVHGRPYSERVDEKTGKLIIETAVDGAVARGVPEDKAYDLYAQIEKFADYAFNKSHAAAYSVLTYRTAYLKCYYLLEYMTAVINNRINKGKKMQQYIAYLKRKNVQILPPDVNYSEVRFSIEGNAMRYGLMGAKNVGENALRVILEERDKNGKFKSLYDFIERAASLSLPIYSADGVERTGGACINKRMVESLIKGGAMDSFGMTRSSLLACYEQIMDIVMKEKKHRVEGQLSFFDMEDVSSSYDYPTFPEMDKLQLLGFEKQVLGMYVSGHPLDDYMANFDGMTTRGLLLLDEELDEESYVAEGEDDSDESQQNYNTELNGKTVTMGGIVQSIMQGFSQKSKRPYVKGVLEDLDGIIDFMVTGKSSAQILSLLESGVPVKVTGELSVRVGDKPTLFIKDAVEWQKPTQRVSQAEKPESKEDNATAKSCDDKLKLQIKDFDEAKSLMPILRVYTGESEVIGVFPDGEEKVFRVTVRICNDLLFDLSDKIGRNRIKIIRGE